MKGGIALKRVMPSSPLRLFCFFLLKNAACFHTQSKTPGQRKSLVMPHLLVCACFLRVTAPVSNPLRQQSLRGHLEKKLLFFRCFYPLFLVVGIFHETIRRSTQFSPTCPFALLTARIFLLVWRAKKSFGRCRIGAKSVSSFVLSTPSLMAMHRTSFLAKNIFV